MENKKIILCRGIQGSGKTSFAKKWAAEDPEHRVRFNNDDIRNMLGQYWVPSREDVIAEIKHKFIITVMHKGYDIIIDNMNLNPKEVKFYEDLIKDWNNCSVYSSQNVNYKIEFKDFFIPVEECIRRDAMRPNPIGEKVIRQTWNKYKHFIQVTSINNYVNSRLKQEIYSKKHAIVLDMDSTLCFNTTGRPWYGPGASEGILNDTVNTPIADLAYVYSEEGYEIFIITGRDTSLKESTERWLNKNGIDFTEVFYRKAKDYRPSADIKKEIVTKLLDKYCIDIIVDDADPVVKMYRDMGLTVLQPNKTI